MEIDYATKLLHTREGRFKLIKEMFGVTITPHQLDIIEYIALREEKRIVISAFTRYGKTYSVAIAVLLYIYLNEGKEVLLIAPDFARASLLRDYIARLALACPELQTLIDITYDNEYERLKKEVSKSRITFKNGCEIRVLSAEGTGQRLMGFGSNGLIVLDESCLIKHEVYRAMISRMLGDSPETKLVEIGNPWHRNNQMWQHWIDPAFVHIYIPYTIGLEEGRITKEHVEQQRKDLMPMEFQVLYDAEFPEEAQDSLFKGKWLQNAIERYNHWLTLPFAKTPPVIGADIAEEGIDFTAYSVLQPLATGGYILLEIIKSNASDTNVIGMELEELANKYNTKTIAVDVIGVGSGVGSYLAHKNYKVIKRKVGQTALYEPARFSNQKAEFYWLLSELFRKDEIAIPNNHELVQQLMQIRWKKPNKVVIIDGKKEGLKSPDLSDSLMLAASALSHANDIPIYTRRR